MKSNTLTGRLNKFIIFALAAILSMSVMFFAACQTKPEDPDKEPEDKVEKEEELPIANGKFDLMYDTTDTSEYPRIPKNWTYTIDGSGDDKAPSSSSDLLHGALSVDPEKWDKINTTKDDEKRFKDLDTSPLSPKKTGEEVEKDKQHVLMMYNKNNTAIRYKSPSISIAADSYAKISVYVKTKNVGTNGAHINITGGVEEPIYVKFINTDAEVNNDNNGYVKYEFYLDGSTMTSKTVYLELGLGYGDKNNQREQESGYVFFDDATVEYMTQKEFIEETKTLAPENTARVNNQPFELENIFNGANSTKFGYSFNAATQAANMPEFGIGADKWTSAQQYVDETGASSSKSNILTVPSDLGTLPEYAKNYKDLLENFPFDSSSNILMLENTQRASLQYKLSNNITLNPYGYYKMSFWAKTSEFDDNTGLNVYLTNGKINKENAGEYLSDSKYVYSSFTNINTPKKDKELDEDVRKNYKWENWQKYTFYINVGKYAAEDVNLEFYLGPMHVDPLLGQEKYYSMPKGAAFITPVNFEQIDKADYTNASAGDNAAKATVSSQAVSTPTIANGGFGNVIASEGDPSKDSNVVQTPSDWYAYSANHSAAGGTNEIPADEDLNNIIHGVNYYMANGYNDHVLKIGVRSGEKASAFGYFSPYKTVSANSYYRVSVRVKVENGANYAIYLVDKDGKILGDSTYKLRNLKDEDIPEDEKENDYFIYEKDGKATMFFESNAASDWKEYTFYFNTKNDAKDFRIELWNGNNTNRDRVNGSSEKTATGTVYFDDVQFTSITKDGFDKAVKDAGAEANFKKDSDTASYTYFSADTIIVDYTRANPTEYVEEEEKDEEEEEEEEAEFNWGLLVTGISTGLIVVALLIVGIRKLSQKKIKIFRRRKKAEESNYSSETKRNFASNEKKTIEAKESKKDIQEADTADNEDVNLQETEESEDNEESEENEEDNK